MTSQVTFQRYPARESTGDKVGAHFQADCKVLGYNVPATALRKLDPEEQELVVLDGPSGGKHTVFVTESGLYSLILRSKKPEAEAFVDWLTEEVLPSIRKHGFWRSPEAEAKAKAERVAEAEAESARMFMEVRQRCSQALEMIGASEMVPLLEGQRSAVATREKQ